MKNTLVDSETASLFTWTNQTWLFRASAFFRS